MLTSSPIFPPYNLNFPKSILSDGLRHKLSVVNYSSFHPVDWAMRLWSVCQTFPFLSSSTFQPMEVYCHDTLIMSSVYLDGGLPILYFPVRGRGTIGIIRAMCPMHCHFNVAEVLFWGYFVWLAHLLAQRYSEVWAYTRKSLYRSLCDDTPSYEAHTDHVWGP